MISILLLQIQQATQGQRNGNQSNKELSRPDARHGYQMTEVIKNNDSKPIKALADRQAQDAAELSETRRELALAQQANMDLASQVEQEAIGADARQAVIDRMEADLDGEHPLGSQHNYGAVQQIETGHLTDAFGGAYLRELTQAMWSTGLLGVRQYALNQAFASGTRRTHAVFSAFNLHDHSNYRSMPGTGELMALANGYYIRMRHQDYIMKKSVQATGTEADYTYSTEQINAPDIKASVLALPTGVNGDLVDFSVGTQAEYFKNIYTDNPQDVEAHMAYLEIWLQDYTGEQQDVSESFRHEDVISNIRELLEEGNKHSAEGTKDILENLAFLNAQKINLGATGAPSIATLNARVMVAKVGSLADLGTTVTAPVITIATASSHFHVLDQQMTDQQAQDLRDGTVSVVTLTSTDVGHTHNYDITWNGTNYVGVDTGLTGHVHEVLIEQVFTGNLPWDETKALNGVIDNENQYSIVDEYWGDVVDRDNVMASRWPRFTVENLDRICERVPGMDGEGAFFIKQNPADDSIDYLDRDGGILNAAYYHRRITRAQGDAAGRQFEDAGFNDSNLFVAKNTKSNVVNQVSYMIPLEIIFRSPIENWNPYQITQSDRASIQDSGAAGTQASPYEDYSENHFYYLTPYAFYPDTNANIDPADTSGSKWMVSGVDGVARRCWGSGIKPHTPDRSQRIRVPIYAVCGDFSYEGGRVLRLEKQVKPLHPFDAQGAEISPAILAANLVYPPASYDYGKMLPIKNTSTGATVIVMRTDNTSGNPIWKVV